MAPTGIEALFNDTQVQVLKLLLLHQDRDFYQREIANRLHLHLRSVQQVLQRLVDPGLVLQEKRGRQVFYRANPDHPIAAELTAILVKTVGLGDRLREVLQKLDDKIELAFVYGSWARGDQRPESDVDLLVVGQAELPEVVSALHEAMTELGRELNPVVISSRELRQRVRDQDHFITSVMDDPKIYLIGDESDLRRIVAEAPH